MEAGDALGVGNISNFTKKLAPGGNINSELIFLSCRAIKFNRRNRA